MTKFINESIVTQAVARKELTADNAAKLLKESNDGFKFSKGQKVYVAHGIHAGSYGNFMGEANGGYANVDLHAAGKTYLVPLIFLMQSQNKGAA